jgi:cytoskeletal protein CcmA (bactofilin family)
LSTESWREEETAIVWNRKKEEPTPEEPRRVDIATPQPPVQQVPRQEPPRRGSVIGPAMSIKGEVASREELQIDGQIEGSLQVDNRVTVGKTGKVRANVSAKELHVFGAIHGNVKATERVVIRKDASLVGDIVTAGIVVDDGAYFKGSIDIIRPNEKKPESGPAPAQQRTPGAES